MSVGSTDKPVVRKFEINFKILDFDNGYDVILGRKDIIKYNLFDIFNEDNNEFDLRNMVTKKCKPRVGVNVLTEVPLSTHTSNPKAPLVDSVASLRQRKQDVLDNESDGEEDAAFDPGLSEMPTYGLPEFNSTGETQRDLIELITFTGTTELQVKTRALCEEFRHLFSLSVSTNPAKINPMHIQVDREAWCSNQNRGPPRPQTKSKQDDLVKQITLLLQLGVLNVSQASEYSPVHLVPKPDGSWRFCIDFRRLNSITKSMGWPIPNIKQLLDRLGAKRPKYFGVVDLTSGYHQAPLAADSQHLTAFITHMGVFEWTRAVMGLKGAGSYFQQEMSTTVLIGLLYDICELYLDDILVHAQTEEAFIANLRKLFERLSKHGITMNPKKCRFGFSELEYVGHVINELGLTFSREKIEKVLNISRMDYHKQLKSFLGLANYFRDHIKDYASLTHPLQEIIKAYSPHKRIVWNREADLALERIKEAINNCPTLFFLNDTDPIILHTDASQYGIGAYLFQIVDGVARPVMFISKGLTANQIAKWSTPEKEAFAIFYALRKLEYLLRDVQFTIRTDHRNLTFPFLNSEGSAKVKRWKLFIQQYDFDIEFIAGEDNVVADAFSRLLPYTVENAYSLFEFKMPREIYKLIGKYHNSTIGHFGVDKTIEKILQHVPAWESMRHHVKRFIKECPCCQKMSFIKYPIQTRPYTLARYQPWECLNVDSIGALPMDDEGNKYIIVIIDCFTRFVELVPTRSTDAKSAARAVLQVVGRFGCPTQILSDNGTQYCNETMTELERLIGIEPLTVLAGSKEENALVERANREVTRHLRNIIFDQKVISAWGSALPLVQRIMNSTVHESLGVAPAQLLFGNALNLDRRVILDKLEVDGNTECIYRDNTISNWSSQMLQMQETLLQLAFETQKKKDNLHVSSADANRTEFPINSYVLVEYTSAGHFHGAPNKLVPRRRGPMRIVNVVGSTYTVENLETGKWEDFHITQLRPFHYDAEEVNPRLVAQADRQLFDIEAVIKHRGDPWGSKKSLEFLVKWVGDAEPTWNEYKDLRDTEALHQYLREKKMLHLIPRKFK